jgi:potassium-transporting ATPase KdpC subunit
VSPANAFAQVPAVARARGLNEARVRDLVVRAVRKPALGFLSAPRVNVLLLNLALDQLRSS